MCIASNIDCVMLQQDINVLHNWSLQLQQKFNFARYFCMSLLNPSCHNLVHRWHLNYIYTYPERSLNSNIQWLSWEKLYEYIISEAYKVSGTRHAGNSYHYPLIKDNFTQCVINPNSLIIHSYGILIWLNTLYHIITLFRHNSLPPLWLK